MRTPETRQLSAPEQWVERYGDYLYAYALNRVKDPAAAEDLVQDTFLAALGARETFKGHSSEKTWLTGILKHKILDRFRKDYKEIPDSDIEAQANNLDDAFDEKGHWKVGPAKWIADPREQFERKKFMEALYDCLAVPPKRLADAFILREIDGLGTKEICKVLNVSETNLWVMLHRVRMSVRECLENNWLDA